MYSYIREMYNVYTILYIPYILYVLLYSRNVYDQRNSDRVCTGASIRKTEYCSTCCSPGCIRTHRRIKEQTRIRNFRRIKVQGAYCKTLTRRNVRRGKIQLLLIKTNSNVGTGIIVFTRCVIVEHILRPHYFAPLLFLLLVN